MKNWRGFQIYDYNIPEQRPGVYRYLCLDNGKSYIGISQNVATRGHDEKYSPKKFANAIKKHGRASFILEPIFYWTDGIHDREWLCRLEADLIIVYDSIKNGYNVKAADGGVGPYGLEFSNIQKAAHSKPETIERDIIAGRKAGIISMSLKTKEERIEFAKLGALHGSVKAGTASAARRTKEEHSSWAKRMNDNLSPEKRIINARKAGIASMAKLTPQEISNLAKKGGEARRLQFLKIKLDRMATL